MDEVTNAADDTGNVRPRDCFPTSCLTFLDQRAALTCMETVVNIT